MKTKCLTCINSLNCVNGRYCTKTRVYVEHHEVSECDNYKTRQ